MHPFSFGGVPFTVEWPGFNRLTLDERLVHAWLALYVSGCAHVRRGAVIATQSESRSGRRKCDQQGQSGRVFQFRRGLSDRIRNELTQKHRAPSELRPRREMDNFSCSHHCTSTVRLWLGARWCLLHRRVPLYYLVFLISTFFFLPRPSR
jgi:hypothetical protein